MNQLNSLLEVNSREKDDNHNSSTINDKDIETIVAESNAINQKKSYKIGKKYVLIGTLILLFSIIYFLWPSTPRNEFKNDLFSKMDNLISVLENFGPESVSVNSSMVADGTVAEGKSEISKSELVISAANSVYNRLNTINVAQYYDLKDARNDEDWVMNLNNGFNERLNEIKKELNSIRVKYQKSPDSYVFQPNYSGISSSLFSYKIVSIQSNEVIFMHDFSNGISLSPLLNTDINNWIKTLKFN